MNVRERKLKREIRRLREEYERLTDENTFYREEYEILTAENIHLWIENETLKQDIAELKGKKSKKRVT